MGTIAILSGLVVFLLVVLAGVLYIERRDQRELRGQLARSQNEYITANMNWDTANREVARLTGELSKAQNTLALAAVEEAAQKAGKREPIKARTAADVRQAVERVNLQEQEREKADGE